MGKKEKTGLIVLVTFSVSLPFLMIRNPLEMSFLSLPTLFWYPVMAGVWFYSGKDFWEVFLASYGGGNVGITCIYFGISLAQFILKKISSRKNISKTETVLSKIIDLTQGKRKKIINWLNRQSLWLILLIFALPLPWSDSIATVAMRLKRIKHGIWYLYGLNVIHVLLVVFLIHSGISLFF